MTLLAEQRCYNHAAREAASRCPSCGRFFCRECTTEHEGRFICAACLAGAASAPPRRRRWRGLLRAGQVAAGFVLLWTLFYVFGRLLLAIPSAYHDNVMLDAPPATDYYEDAPADGED